MGIERDPTLASGRQEAPHVSFPAGSQASALIEGALVADKYRLIKQLGKGGMGEVWRAEHRDLRTEVAIKFVYESLAQHASFGGAAIERFRFEAQIAARLAPRTRHVVAVYDTGTFNGCPFLVMELVPGQTLDDEIAANGPLDPLRFASILDQVADAVDAAHALGIAHRDIKPPNILVVNQPDGSLLAKVADFGVAKALIKDIPLDKPKETMMGELVGSPAYMSPEQVSAKAVGPETDIWSLGVVAFEALTGKHCFECTSLGELMSSIIAQPAPAMSSHRPELPRAVDAWLAKAMAKEPSDRFTSVRAMATAFREALKVPERRRRGVKLIAAGTISAVIASLIVGALLLTRPPPPIAQAATSTALAAPTQAPAASVEAPSAAPEEPSSTVALPAAPRGGARPNRSAKTAVTSPPPSPPTRSPPVESPQPPPPPPPAPKPPKRIDPSEIQ